MQFEWDEEKNATNIQETCGFDFADGLKLFSGQMPLLVAANKEGEYDEERWQGIGMIEGHIVVVIFAERQPGLIRLISLRKANREERCAYEQAIKDELGPH